MLVMSKSYLGMGSSGTYSRTTGFAFPAEG